MSSWLGSRMRAARQLAARIAYGTAYRLAPVAQQATASGARRYVAQTRRARIRAHPDARASTEDDVLSSAYRQLIEKYAPGHSFLDVGCMWRVHGAVSFLAEEVGATAVTAFDAMGRTPQFDRTHATRNSRVRYTGGNLFDRRLREQAGPHDVVWCTGVAYHTPDPVALVEDLQAAATRYLILGTKAIPEIPGFPQAAVYLPRLPPESRRTWAQLWGSGVAAPFGQHHMKDANWWWLLSPSAMTAIVVTDPAWHIRDVVDVPWSGADDNFFLVAERQE